MKRLWCDLMHSYRQLFHVGSGVWECGVCGVQRVHPAVQEKPGVPVEW